MGKKIFISYKYSDNHVFPIKGIGTTARDYVDELSALLVRDEDHIYKGEDDGQDLSALLDETIATKLGDKIFDSSVTIVLISKGMKDFTAEKDQWIPWEISYSLRQQARSGKTSKSNAVIAVVLPDENSSYDYFMTENPTCRSVTYHTEFLFRILAENMFNLKTKENNVRECNGSKIYEGYPSYIFSVKWSLFRHDRNFYLEIAEEIKNNIASYNICKVL